MINNLLKNNFHILICFLSILSIYLGFFFGENITIGPKLDFEHALPAANEFQKNFKYTLLNFDKALDDIQAATRISPIYLIIIFILKKILIDVDLVRFFWFHGSTPRRQRTSRRWFCGCGQYWHPFGHLRRN